MKRKPLTITRIRNGRVEITVIEPGGKVSKHDASGLFTPNLRGQLAASEFAANKIACSR